VQRGASKEPGKFSSFVLMRRRFLTYIRCPYGPMDKAPAYGAGDSGFESRYGLTHSFSFNVFFFFQ
jgi:hypothetical protein